MKIERYEQAIKSEAILKKQVFVTDDHIIINVDHEYPIELFRCNTPEKILWWVWHLTEKIWMTNLVMRRFIELACKKNSIEMKEF